MEGKGKREVLVLGAGMTGLAAGWASGLPVLEANDVPGGICASYYIRPDEGKRRWGLCTDQKAYRFEIGGGHWIWGADAMVLVLLSSLTSIRVYRRKSAVFFPDSGHLVPYPVQYHVSRLGSKLSSRVLEEIARGARTAWSMETLADWLEANFGPTLCNLFFHPFHELYTAGLWRRIAPQDVSKSPVDLSLAVRGALEDVEETGYNPTFMYPVEGLGVLAEKLASCCQVRHGHQVVRVDVHERVVYLSNGNILPYTSLVSTLPLNHMTGEMCGLRVEDPPDPFTSVLVFNIGARKGPCCPSEHWIYVPRSRSGFHRVGFYSNVDSCFLPATACQRGDRVALYVEKAYLGGKAPMDDEVDYLSEAIVDELDDWGWIREPDVVDATWVDVAYTWSWPGSPWRQRALEACKTHGIYQTGRYARWAAELGGQGISSSLREGLVAGTVYGKLQ